MALRELGLTSSPHRRASPPVRVWCVRGVRARPAGARAGRRIDEVRSARVSRHARTETHATMLSLMLSLYGFSTEVAAVPVRRLPL